ncbi:hypothetical protein WFJ45_23740, partial [Salmonella enterica subsp. enterica serovar Minnesota]|uniref:hypothetical protein n=1 Tax=Salmonella enterica TaxID=28901 RepID=UPI003D2C12FD
ELTEVLRILDERTGAPLASPVPRASREGTIAGLARLVRRDGSELPVEDSAAPIRLADGSFHGAVLVPVDR